MDPLVFQAVCWRGHDLVAQGNDSDDDPKQYTIDIFGKTHQGGSVCVHVRFYPYFFVEQMRNCDTAASFKTFLRGKLNARVFRDVQEVSTTERKKLYGFTNNATFRFFRVVFRTHESMRRAAYTLEKARDVLQRPLYTLYESNVDPVLRLIHVCGLQSASWIAVSKYEPVGKLNRTTCVDHEVEAHFRDIQTHSCPHQVAPLVLASFDIECYSPDGSFPNPKEDGQVIQVATTFQRYGESEPYMRHVVCLGETSSVEGVHMVCVEREGQLLVEWAKAVREQQADVLVGYNIWGFDMQFMYTRAANEGACSREEQQTFLRLLGKYTRHASKMKNETLSSSAYGNNEWQLVETLGVLQLDLLPIIKKEHKLESYKLDRVALHFLGDQKMDLPIKELFELFTGNAADRRRIAEYCVKDTELPLRLLSRLSILPNMVEMANATYVPLEFLIPRGQQIKAFSQILQRARTQGYLCPTDTPKHADKYEGATVLEAMRGVYWDVVTCLDFASLYPSIMRAHNMCHTTVVLDDAKYGHLENVEYLEVEGVKFAQNVDSILPGLLEDLAQFRKEAKKQQAAAKARGDALMESLCNGKQLAYKISMNSIYGFCGAPRATCPAWPSRPPSPLWGGR